ncbi:MAG: hypothetical protein H6742_01965 [Alphaproteobacteria bacterium]|nr:hypothetical protein [Alphaproteobacteria bacterium]
MSSALSARPVAALLAGTALCCALVSGPAAAVPMDDLPARLVERSCRVESLPCVLGATDHGRLRQAGRIQLDHDHGLASERVQAAVRFLVPDLVAAQDPRIWWGDNWGVEPLGGLSVGDLAPRYRAGDTEPGMFSARAGAQGRMYPGPFELLLSPEARLDVAPTTGSAALREAWAGVHVDGLVVGFGLRDRHQGPGRFGSLLLSDAARPAPLGTVAWTSSGGGRLGRVHLEVGAGWLTGERSDVQRPGWILMDARWLVLSGIDAMPGLEVGVGRVGIFGGVGRPAPPLSQLLLPTRPHVYDDPDRVEPDQDEMAAVDVRLTLPIGRWAGIRASDGRVDGLDYVELWVQHGGEDVIARELGPIPYPSLAGVGNLFGAEVAAGPLVLTVEHARLLDDYFRWYTGHRVYHEGYTQDGIVMGHGMGGDALGTTVGLSWEPGAWAVGIEGSVERKVGVVEALGDNLLALAADEEHLGVDLWGLASIGPGWWRGDVEVERIRSVGYTPGDDEWVFRVAVGR